MSSALAGKPSTRVIVGVAACLFGCVLMAIAIHELLSTGTCSSTGYTQFGPAPRCPKGSGWYTAFLMGAVVLTIVSAFALGSNIAVAALFGAIGVGSLLV